MHDYFTYLYFEKQNHFGGQYAFPVRLHLGFQGTFPSITQDKEAGYQAGRRTVREGK